MGPILRVLVPEIQGALCSKIYTSLQGTSFRPIVALTLTGGIMRVRLCWKFSTQRPSPALFLSNSQFFKPFVFPSSKGRVGN